LIIQCKKDGLPWDVICLKLVDRSLGACKNRHARIACLQPGLPRGRSRGGHQQQQQGQGPLAALLQQQQQGQGLLAPLVALLQQQQGQAQGPGPGPLAALLQQQQRQGQLAAMLQQAAAMQQQGQLAANLAAMQQQQQQQQLAASLAAMQQQAIAAMQQRRARGQGILQHIEQMVGQGNMTQVG
jgi:hypothetical protein